jgi:hypothetical protein
VRAPRLFLLAVGLALPPPAARAAHEWRAAWAAPYPLPHIEAAVLDRGGHPHLAVTLEQPFGLRHVSFQTLRARLPLTGLELHAGSLRAEPYREWHLGIARGVRLGETAALLPGLRLFGLSPAGAASATRIAGTLIGRLQPPGIPFLRLEAGLVDVGERRGSSDPSAVAFCRLGLSGAGYRLAGERLVLDGAGVETNLAVSVDQGGLRLGCGLRCANGEASLILVLPHEPFAIGLAQRWHPRLGCTPAIRLAWHRGR